MICPAYLSNAFSPCQYLTLQTKKSTQWYTKTNHAEKVLATYETNKFPTLIASLCFINSELLVAAPSDPCILKKHNIKNY